MRRPATWRLERPVLFPSDKIFFFCDSFSVLQKCTNRSESGRSYKIRQWARFAHRSRLPAAGPDSAPGTQDARASCQVTQAHLWACSDLISKRELYPWVQPRGCAWGVRTEPGCVGPFAGPRSPSWGTRGLGQGEKGGELQASL